MASADGAVRPQFAIPPLDTAAYAAAQRRLDDLTKPQGSLGKLETLAARLCAMRGSLTVSAASASALVFAADHGLAREGVSAYPREVTAQMIANFLGGGAAISVLAREQGFALTIVDVGVDAELAPHRSLIDAKLARGSANALVEPALTRTQVDAAIQAGATVARTAIDAGSDVILLGEMGIGNTAIGALLLHQLTGWPLTDCVGRGTGVGDQQLRHKRAVLSRAAARIAATGLEVGEPACALDYLHQCGGFEFGALAGALLASAERRTPILVDGFAVTVAAALAAALHPNVLDYCVFAHVSAEQAHRRLLSHLGAQALLDLDLRLGEASGAALALPLVRAAVALFTRMATFSSASVSR